MTRGEIYVVASERIMAEQSLENRPPKLASARSIQEFWIDFLLEEEFTVDPDFLPTFLGKCGFDHANAKVLQVAHSVSARDQYGGGESDLIVLYTYGRESDDTLGALLIEDKINAAYQPHQAERYRYRGQQGVTTGSWDTFQTVLIAPSGYISERHGFDAAVSLEAIMDWICVSDPRRRAFRKARLEAAIAKKNTVGVKIPDETMTAFRQSFFSFLSEVNAHHGVGFAPARPEKSVHYYDDNWFELTRSGLPAASEFRYMSRTGIVELGFKNTHLENLRPLMHNLLEGAELKSTGRRKQHTALQVRVEPINDFSSFEEQRPKIERAMNALLRVSRFYEESKLWLEPAVAAARQSSQA